VHLIQRSRRQIEPMAAVLLMISIVLIVVLRRVALGVAMLLLIALPVAIMFGHAPQTITQR